MSVTIDIPDEIAQQLQAQWGNLPQRALEALAIEGYRSEALSLGQVAEMLAISVMEAESFLKEKGIDMPYDEEDLNEDLAVSERIL